MARLACRRWSGVQAGAGGFEGPQPVQCEGERSGHAQVPGRSRRRPAARHARASGDSSRFSLVWITQREGAKVPAALLGRAVSAAAIRAAFARGEAGRMLQPAVHCAILIVDVEGFGDPARTNADQLAVRDGMYQALRRSFSSARISWAGCVTEDRGDGVLVLVPPVVPKSWLVTRLPAYLAEALVRHNAACRSRNGSGCGWRCMPGRFTRIRTGSPASRSTGPSAWSRRRRQGQLCVIHPGWSR